MKAKIRKVSFGILLCPLSFLYSQNTITAYVLDEETASPLEAATIGAKHKAYGCYADNTGKFDLTYLDEKDSIRITHIGYEDNNTTVEDLIGDSVVYLKARYIGLEEVVVVLQSYRKTKKLDLGYFNRKNKLNLYTSFEFYLTAYSQEIPYPENGEKVVVQSIDVALYPLSNNFPIVIKLLLKDEYERPSQEIYMSEIIDFKDIIPFKELKYKIDISNENLTMLQEGLFVVIEYLIDYPINSSNVNYGPCIRYKEADQAQTIFLRRYNQDHWESNSCPCRLSVGLSVLNYIK